jgi:hypothetical protein
LSSICSVCSILVILLVLIKVIISKSFGKKLLWLLCFNGSSDSRS